MEPTNPPKEHTFMSLYLAYTSQTESPTFYHRWCGLTTLAAWLGRDIHLPFGHQTIHPNMYVMLVGLAGTKKSTSIKIGAKVLKKAGYKTFAARKTRQEKYLTDLAEHAERVACKASNGDLAMDILDENLFGDGDLDEMDAYMGRPAAESFIAADEVNNFIGTGNLDFMSILGDLWDFEGVFDYKLKNSKSVYIPDPTINLLGGNTFVGFNKLFPPEALEQGFFSRTLFIYAEPKGRIYTIPPDPDPQLELALITKLAEIKANVRGKITLTDDAYKLLDTIYHKWEGMDDPRFDSYENRRLVHLLKLAMLVAAGRLSTTLEVSDVMEASTILTFTEHLMPKALGEFGKSKTSEVMHKVMSALDMAHKPMTFKDIWKVVVADLDNRNQLVEIISSLQMADKIQVIDGNGYLPNKKVRSEGVVGAVDWSFLTQEEREMIV